MRWPFGNPRPARHMAAEDDAEIFDEEFQKRLEYLALVSRRVFSGRTRAERRSRKIGAGVEFADYRRYSAGDDYRQIDWNVYGRIDRLVLRLYEEEEDLSVYLLIDCSASMGFGRPQKLRYAKTVAAALAYIALSHLDRVAIAALTDTVVARLAPTRGKNRIFAIFEFLRTLTPDGSTQLSEAIGTFVARHKRRGLVILLSDLYDPAGLEDGINKLRYARFETHVIQLVEPADAEPTLHGDIELRDAETGEVRAVTATAALLSRYRAAYQAHQQRITAFCLQKQVNLTTLSTQTPFDEAVLHLLRSGGLVA